MTVIHRLPPTTIALANARTVVRSSAAQDSVTLLIACDVLDTYGDWLDRETARNLRAVVAPSLAREVNARTRQRHLIAACAMACLLAWLVAVDPVGRLVADVRQAQEVTP